MLDHLLELRRRLLWVFVFFGIFFFGFYWQSDLLLHVLFRSLLSALSTHQSLITTQLTASLFIPIRLAANAAVLAVSPMLLYHSWHFIAPGLYKHERKGFGSILIISLLLLVSGALFCFYWVLPSMFHLMIHSTAPDVKLMPDLSSSLDFITSMLLTFGFCFQVPLICFVLVHVNIISLTELQRARPYCIVLAFIVGMILTPPDVISQILLAVPLCLLFESGILLARASAWFNNVERKSSE